MRTQLFGFVAWCLAGGSGVVPGGSALAADLAWPARSSDPSPWPAPKESGKVFNDRFSRASARALGTADDSASIRKTITKHLKPQEVEARQIRWLTPTLVMAYTRTRYAAFYYVAEKKDEWEVLTHYMLWIE